MNCSTIRKGMDCPFMTAKGCAYNGGICHEIIEKCDGCNRQVAFASEWYCTACPDPSIKWKNGNCNLASHVAKETSSAKSKINPLKASKRGRR